MMQVTYKYYAIEYRAYRWKVSGMLNLDQKNGYSKFSAFQLEPGDNKEEQRRHNTKSSSEQINSQ